MSVDWRRLSREAGLRVHGDAIDVGFADGRRQAVFVDETAERGIRIWSVAAPHRVARDLGDPLLHVWRRNRLTELVGFSIDGRGRIIGEAWVPASGVTVDEWDFYVRELARVSDRVEYVLTGSDEE